eukprot:57691-Chlamydomonas_euryale.AAC.3
MPGGNGERFLRMHPQPGRRMQPQPCLSPGMPPPLMLHAPPPLQISQHASLHSPPPPAGPCCISSCIPQFTAR